METELSVRRFSYRCQSSLTNPLHQPFQVPDSKRLSSAFDLKVEMRSRDVDLHGIQSGGGEGPECWGHNADVAG